MKTFQNIIRRISNNSGITLIEILVVLAIISVLGSVVATQVAGHLDRAKVTTAKSEMKTLEQALQLYKMDNDFYPTTEQGLQALIEKPAAGTVPENWREGGYLEKKKMPVDPWKTPYIYICEDGEKYTIVSYGKDKKEGGTENSTDISSDDL